MTRPDLIKQLSRRFPQLNVVDAELVVKAILETIAKTLISGGRIEIRGFGGFGLNCRPPRIGQNPKTGESVPVSAKYAAHFKPGKELKEIVNK